jgi:hypothetical protein
MSRKVRWAGLLIAILLSFGALKGASAYCLDNSNSSLQCESEGTDCYCGATGGGCSSCFNSKGGGDSWSLCYYDWETEDVDCTYAN